MFVRLLFMSLAVVLCSLPFTSTVSAAPAPTGIKGSGPGIVVQVQSVNDIIEKLKTTAKNLGGDELVKIFEQEVLPKLNPDLLPGFDPKKPIGFYGDLDAGIVNNDISKCRFVSFFPITDEKKFLNAIGLFGLKPEAKDGGLYLIKLPDPDAPQPLQMRFHKNYVFFGMGKENVLDPKGLIDPQDLINPKETSLLYVRMSGTAIPKEFQEMSKAQQEEALNKLKETPLPVSLQKPMAEYFKMMERWTKITTDNYEESSYRIDIDSKTGEIVIESGMVPKAKTILADYIGGIKTTRNQFASAIGKDSAAHILFSFPLAAPELRNIFSQLLDEALKELPTKLDADGASKEVKELSTEGLKLLQRTVESGEMDVAVSLRGPDKNANYAVVLAVQVKDTTPFEKAARAAIKTAPKEIQQKIKLDAGKAGTVSYHEFTIEGNGPPSEKVFGKDAVGSLAFGKDAIILTIGTRGKELIQEALESKPTPSPVFHIEASGPRLRTIIKATGGNVDGENGSWIEKLILNQEKLPVFSIQVVGGSDLKMTFRTGPMFLSSLFMARAAQGGNAPPVPKAIEKKAENNVDK